MTEKLRKAYGLVILLGPAVEGRVRHSTNRTPTRFTDCSIAALVKAAEKREAEGRITKRWLAAGRRGRDRGGWGGVGDRGWCGEA